MATPPYGTKRPENPRPLHDIPTARPPARKQAPAGSTSRTQTWDPKRAQSSPSKLESLPPIVPISEPPIDVFADIEGEPKVDTLRGQPEPDALLGHAVQNSVGVSCPAPRPIDELDMELDDNPLALADKRPTTPPPNREASLMGEMLDRYALADFSGALSIAEQILELNPENKRARDHAENCRETLLQMYTMRLGSMAHRPYVLMTPDQIRWLNLDHRAGFLLSCIDGHFSVEEVLDVCGMSTIDAMRILVDLAERKIIAVKPS